MKRLIKKLNVFAIIEFFLALLSFLFVIIIIHSSQWIFAIPPFLSSIFAIYLGILCLSE